jgi:hypothetical protein
MTIDDEVSKELKDLCKAMVKDALVDYCGKIDVSATRKLYKFAHDHNITPEQLLRDGLLEVLPDSEYEPQNLPKLKDMAEQFTRGKLEYDEAMKGVTKVNQIHYDTNRFKSLQEVIVAAQNDPRVTKMVFNKRKDNDWDLTY